MRSQRECKVGALLNLLIFVFLLLLQSSFQSKIWLNSQWVIHPNSSIQEIKACQYPFFMYFLSPVTYSYQIFLRYHQHEVDALH